METPEARTVPKPEYVLSFVLNHVIGQSQTSPDPIARAAWQVIDQDPLLETVIREAIERYQQTPTKKRKAVTPILTSALAPIFNKLWETYPPQDLISPPPQPPQPQP